MNRKSAVLTLSATEIASRKWFDVELPEIEEFRHQRLINALRTLNPVPDRTLEVCGPWLPGKRWRYEAHENHNRLRASTCRLCRGTREMKIYIDRPAAPCANCQDPNPYARNEGEQHVI